MIHLEEGKVYRSTHYLYNHGSRGSWKDDGWLWVYMGQSQHTIYYQFKSVATGKNFFCIKPFVYFEGAER
jgi:hypothetical protein